MSPKEKAQELYDDFYDLGHLIETDYAKQHCKKCAIISAKQMIKSIQKIQNQIYSSQVLIEHLEYWNSVKEEINKL